MTNKERLISLCGFGPDNNSLEGVLIDLGITGSDTYSVAQSVDLKRGAIQLMYLLITTADTTNENGYVIKYDRDAILKRIALLEQELDVTDALPTITGRHVW